MAVTARPTLESVARHAEVSRQTVSNALNAPHRVRPDTLERVLAAIDELGYRPNQAARTLRTRRSRLLGARIEPTRDGVNGVVLDRFLHALTASARDRGYRVLLFSADDDGAEIAQYDELLEDHALDAFVLTATHVGDVRTDWLADRDVPFVTFGRPWGAAGAARHSWVDVDGAAGTRDATLHLREAGHERIGFVGWPAGSGVGDDRRAGWSSVCADAGLDCGGLDVARADGLDEGRSAVAELLALPQPPTAVVCASDSLALGAWTELTARGLEPGRDVAVVGFDDSPTAAVVGLSSVAQPLDAAAAACLDALETVLVQRDRRARRLPDEAPSAPSSTLLPPHLVRRRSS